MQAVATGRRLPADMEQWNSVGVATVMDQSAWIPDKRFWDRGDLAAGISEMHAGRMESFFEKLNSGQPVTVVAFGDSITKDGGA